MEEATPGCWDVEGVPAAWRCEEEDAVEVARGGLEVGWDVVD